MDRRLLIVDGSNLLFQMFYGMPSRIVNEQGKPIQGTLGFVGALLKILRRFEPAWLAVLFDGEHENARAGLDPDYKSNRIDYSKVSEEESPFSQIDDVYAALDYMGIAHTETTDCEADDLIAGYALAYGRGTDIVISSFDSDFFQLLTDRVSVFRYRGKDSVLWTPDSFREKFTVRGFQIPYRRRGGQYQGGGGNRPQDGGVAVEPIRHAGKPSPPCGRDQEALRKGVRAPKRPEAADELQDNQAGRRLAPALSSGGAGI